MSIQSQFYRYNNDSDQGTWQQPAVQVQGVDDTSYYTGAPQNYFTSTTSGGTSTSSGNGQAVSGLGIGMPNQNVSSQNNAFTTGISNFKGSSGSKNSIQSGNATFMSATMSNQMINNTSDMMSKQIQDDSGDGGYYGFPNEAYVTNPSGNMMNSMGNSGNYNTMNQNMMGNFSQNVMTDTNMAMGNSGNMMNRGGNAIGNVGINPANGNFGNQEPQSQFVSSAGMGTPGRWQSSFGHGNTGSYNTRHRTSDVLYRRARGRRVGGSSTRFKGPEMYHDYYKNKGQNLTVQFNATNHNQWCFLRKHFNKRDDDLVQHLFEVHEKFCHHCKERIEERRSAKKKKVPEEESKGEVADVEVREEDLTEEELAMRELMGFAGFRSTKGAKGKDNSYSTMISGNSKPDAVDGTTTLTDAEKKMIASIGGFSVFSKNNGNASSGDKVSSASVGFGAPAVTMTPMESSGTQGEVYLNK